jgi:hypothetical protein
LSGVLVRGVLVRCFVFRIIFLAPTYMVLRKRPSVWNHNFFTSKIDRCVGIADAAHSWYYNPLCLVYDTVHSRLSQRGIHNRHQEFNSSIAFELFYHAVQLWRNYCPTGPEI